MRTDNVASLKSLVIDVTKMISGNEDEQLISRDTVELIINKFLTRSYERLVEGKEVDFNFGTIYITTRNLKNGTVKPSLAGYLDTYSYDELFKKLNDTTKDNQVYDLTE